jgi:hypothetical protein
MGRLMASSTLVPHQLRRVSERMRPGSQLGRYAALKRP